MSVRGRLVATFVAASLTVWASSAVADDAPRTSVATEVESLLGEGDAAFVRKDYLTAFARYDAAARIEASARVLVRSARALAAAGKLVEARAAARRAEWSSRRDDDRESALRLEAEAIRTTLEPRLATFAATVTGDGRVSLDGEVLSEVARSTRRAINPGPHELRFEAKGGATEVRKIDAKEGEAITVELGVVATRGPILIEKTSPLVYVGILSGAVGLLLAVPMGIATIESAQSCPESGCDEATYDQALATGWVSTIGFGVAIAGAGLTVTGLFLPRVIEVDPKALPTTTLSVVPGGAVLEMGGTF